MRKTITLLFVFMFLALNCRLSAQMDCVPGTINLTNVKDYCSGKAAETNKNVTPTTGSIPTCWPSNSKNEVWYKFKAIASDVTVDIIKGGANGTIQNVSVAFMSDCNTIDICKVGTAADTLRIYKGGLQTGTTYYIRVSSTAADAGTYTLCIKNVIPPINPAADCDKAHKLCNKDQVILSQLSGPGMNDQEIEASSCFHAKGMNGVKFTEQNSVWYYWVCSKSGKLTFDLTPLDPDGDLDFIVYEVNGTDICKNRSIVRCCGSQCKPGDKTGLNLTETDVSEEFSSANDCIAPKNEYVSALDMVAGKTYALLVNDAIGKSGFTIDFGNFAGSGEFQGPEAKIAADKQSICEDGSVTFNSNSINGDTLIWNFPGGTPSTVPRTAGPHVITYSTPGKYTATLIAKSGSCYTVDQVEITVNETPTVTIADVEICEGNEATLTAMPSVSGGTYSWSPTPTSGDGTATIKASPTSDQTYNVTYTVGGCETTSMGKVSVNKKPEVTVNSESVCAGTSATLTATLKETTGTYTYSWAPDGETTQSITKNPTTKTVYTVTVTSDKGCVGTATGTIDVNGVLTVNAGNDTTICNGATINLNVKPNGTGYVYKWTASTGAVSDPTIYNPTATPTATTTYTVDVTSDKGCSGSDILTVSIDPLMTPVLTPTNVTCFGGCDGKLDVTVTGGTSPYTYSWSSGCTTASCKSLCVNSYSLTVTDKLGCTVQGNTTITQPALLTLQTSMTSSTCGKPDGTATVVASGGTPGSGYAYLWDDPKGQSTATATGLLPKKYCVTVTDANGCKTTACIDVSDKPGITASLVSVTPPSCNGVCDGTAEVAVSGGSGPYTYSWNTSSPQANATAIKLCAGNYVATVTDNATGCMDTVQVKVTQPQAVTLDPVTTAPICIGSNITLTAVPHGGDGNYTFDWLPESTKTTSSISVSPVVSTDYHVVVKDGKGCSSAPLVIKVNVNPPLKVIGSSDANLCIGDSAKLTAVGSGGNGGPYTYTWAPAIAATGSSVIAKPSVSTTYTVTIKDNCGTPAALDSIKVVINASPVVNFSGNPLSGCTPIQTAFKDSSSVTGGVITNWKWDFGDGGQSDSKDPTHVYSTTGTTTGVYSVTLIIKSSNGCTTVLKKDKMIHVYPMPIPNFDAPFSTSILNPVVHFTNNSVGAVSLEWDFGDSLCTPVNNVSTQFSPNHAYSDIGNYCVKLVAKSVGGCKDSILHCLDIDPQFVLFIPNAFTPNGDGDNDVFYAQGEYINDFEMRIFDRWGNMIYYADNISKPWNGKKNNVGEVEPQDVYVYQITIKDNKNKRHKYVGTVTLVKGG
jgi:gliding motility-associated-like protein